MQAEKPHRGRITRWARLFIDPTRPSYGLGYVVSGEHPDARWSWIRTSYVVKHDEATGEIETRNSRYTLVGPELTREFVKAYRES